MVEYASTLPTALTSIGTLFSMTLATTTGAGPPTPPLPFFPLFLVDGGSSPEVAEVLLQPGRTIVSKQRRQNSAFKKLCVEFNFPLRHHQHCWLRPLEFYTHSHQI